MTDPQGEIASFKLDATVARIMAESAERHGVAVGYLRRFVSEEASKAHLARRHGLFDNLRQLVRHEADRKEKDRQEEEGVEMPAQDETV